MRRLCVHASGSISQMPASGWCQRCSIALAAISAARQCVGVEVVVVGGSGEQQQRFAERVELELLVDPVADDQSVPPGYPLSSSVRWSGTALAGDRVGGRKVGPVGVQTVADETHGVIHEGWAPAAATAWPL